MQLARAVLPAAADRRAPRRLDLTGAALVTAGLTALVYGIVQVEHAGPLTVAVLVPLGLGAVALAGFVAVERRSSAPLLRLGLPRVRSLVRACIGVATTSAIYSAVVFVGSFYLQQVRGYEATAAGLAFLPVTLAGGAVSLVGARLVRRLGNRLVAAASLLLGADTLAAFAVAVLATTPATVSRSPQDPAAYLMGALMVAVGASACALLLRPAGDS